MRRGVLSLLLPAMLAGCAGNAIRLEAAGAVRRDGRAAVAVLVASDTGCLPLVRLRIQGPVAPGAGPAPLCLADGPAAPGHAAFAIDIADSPRSALAPRSQTALAGRDGPTARASRMGWSFSSRKQSSSAGLS